MVRFPTRIGAVAAGAVAVGRGGAAFETAALLSAMPRRNEARRGAHETMPDFTRPGRAYSALLGGSNGNEGAVYSRTLMTTRRFCARPVRVLLSATGLVSP